MLAQVAVPEVQIGTGTGKVIAVRNRRMTVISPSEKAICRGCAPDQVAHAMHDVSPPPINWSVIGREVTPRAGGITSLLLGSLGRVEIQTDPVDPQSALPITLLNRHATANARILQLRGLRSGHRTGPKSDVVTYPKVWFDSSEFHLKASTNSVTPIGR